jgi:hypothetical protein
MSDTNRPAIANEKLDVKAAPESKRKMRSSRRVFLSQVGGAAATIAAGTTIVEQGARAATNTGPQDADRSQEALSTDSGSSSRGRAIQSYNNRVRAAQAELNARIPSEVTNGDEQRFPNHIGNYSKGLAHNGIGEVLPSSYASFLRAVNSGRSAMFDQIQMGGNE